MNNHHATERYASRFGRFRERYGPWALVAGGSTGLGAAFVRELASRGLDVVAVARNGERLRVLAAECGERWGVQVQPVELDLLAPDAFERLLDATGGREVGLLVYNAAFPNAGPFLERAVEQQRAVVTLNCLRPTELTRHFGGLMKSRSRGGIVLMSSLTAFNGSPYISSYGATKAFNLILAEGLSYELAKSGIDVTACCAGVITTPNFEEGYGGKASFIQPPKMSPEEVARRTADALGRKSAFIPGAMNNVLSFIMRRIMSRRGAVRLMAKTVEDLSIEERQAEQKSG